jgi:hypothetical protein
MGGRGRARGGGGGGMPIPASSMAYGRKDAPGTINVPPESYPPVFFKAQPLRQHESEVRMGAFKERFLKELRSSPFYLQVTEKNQSQERYSDKYESLNKARDTGHRKRLTFVYDLMPEELRPKLKIKRPTPGKQLPSDNFEEIRKKLDNLEKKEDETEDKEDEEKEEAEGDEIEVYQEEEIEEVTPRFYLAQSKSFRKNNILTIELILCRKMIMR